MKRILFLVLLFVVATTVKAQYPVTQFLGSDSAMVKSRGGLQGRFAPIPFTDTAAANLSRISQYPGALIYTSGVDKYWYRNSGATGWIEFTSSGGSTVNIYNSNGVLTGDRNLDGTGFSLGFHTLSKFWTQSDTVDIELLSGGAKIFNIHNLTSTQDTTTYKPIVVDPITGRVLQSSYWYGSGSGGSTDTTSLSNRINLKVNISDTAPMLTGYTRVRMFLDSLTAIRSAFPYFGTSTDPSASGSRFFDANGNDFYVLNVPTGSGIYSQTSPTLSAFRFNLNEGFGYPPSPAMDYFLTDKYSQIYSTVEYPDILSTFMTVTHAGPPSKSSFIKVSEDTSGSGSVVLSPYGGYLKISSLVSGLDTDSIMTYSSDGMVHKRSPSAFLSGINGVPDSRTLTINGTSYDLSANRSWTITTGDFYNTDGTFSGNRRGNLNGYRLTFDSGQVRYRDTLTSSTGKLYGGIYDYGKSGVEHINYDSLLTSYQSINTVTGVKFGVKDQNNLDTNNYIQVYASGIYSVTDSVPISDSSYKIATTKWVKDQLYGTGGGSGTVTSIGTGYGLSGGTITTTGTLLVDSASLSNYYLRIKDSLTSSNLLGYVTKTVLADSAAAIRTSIGSGGVADGYVDGATFSTSTNTLTLTQTGAADVTVRIPPSYLQNPIDQDSLIKEVNDSVGRIKAVKVVSDHPEILVTTTRNDSINTHTLSKIYISEPIATFSAGAGFAVDTVLFTDSTIYGSFFTDQDSFYIDRVVVVLKGQAGDTLGLQIIHNDSINVTGTVINGGTIEVNSRTTGNVVSVSTNRGIPPNSWVWLKSPTIIDGKKPEYLSVTLIGYKKYQAP